MKKLPHNRNLINYQKIPCGIPIFIKEFEMEHIKKEEQFQKLAPKFKPYKKHHTDY